MADKKPNPALMKPLQPSNELAAVVGSSPLSRTEVVSKVWDYIKSNNLQNRENKRESRGGEKLRAVCGGKSKVSRYERKRHFAQHLSWGDATTGPPRQRAGGVGGASAIRLRLTARPPP